MADIEPGESGEGDIVIPGASVTILGMLSSEIGIDEDRTGLSFKVGRGSGVGVVVLIVKLGRLGRDFCL